MFYTNVNKVLIKSIKLLYLIIILTLLSCKSQDFKTVKKVIDGDTFYTNDGQKIRLAEVDAPESMQAFGQQAKHFLDSMVLYKTVRLVKTATDKYGRSVCEVYIDNIWLNKAIVDAGYAWAYKSLSSLHSVQIQARNAKKGMWVYEYNVPPFKYRSLNK